MASACAECGGKNQAAWLAIERAPKASQLHPEARIVEYTLEIAEKLAPAGKSARALTVNGAVPGPVLRFREGDVARIHVRNRLPRGETSIHWHGLLVPNLEDGMPHLTTPPILAGEARAFEFLLKQAGTYWYHSHTPCRSSAVFTAAS
jgi:FtsP/CotA-like multicopper oxidase with cupredoxin domain